MDNEAQEYIRRNFPDCLPGAAYNLLAEGTKRTAQRNVRILDRWIGRNFGTADGYEVATTQQVPQPVSVRLLVGFMLYRMAGESLSNDIHPGSVSLWTFLHSDITPMLMLLRHQRRIDFTLARMLHGLK